jgi:hypothetical protein
MSGRPVPPANRRSPWFIAGVVGCALAVAAVPAPAVQPPPTLDGPDAQAPLPPKQPQRPPVAAQFRFPSAGAPLYKAIEDNQPVRSEKENPGEYAAWVDLILHARQFPAADLERHAARDLTPDDLTYPIPRLALRFELIRFDGRLTDVRRVPPTRAVEEAGVKDLYEGWLVPADESPANPVCVVFSELPPGIEPGPQPADRWVSFAGYSFKLLAYPGPEAEPNNPKAGGWLKAPLLIGRTVTPLPGPPPETTAIELNKDLRIFQLIQDDTRMNADPNVWEEGAAWTRVVLHARKFTTGQLEEAARRDLNFASLFTDVRTAYKLDLVYLEGQLIRLSRGTPNRRLAAAGVAEWYEGWLIPKAEPRGNPVCIVITDLPPGLEPKPSMNVWVSFAGYSFKRMHYTSGEPSRKDPDRNIPKAAPLLIGRSVTIWPEPVGPGTWVGQFMPLMLGGVLLIVGTALALGWWYRRSDRRAKAEADAVRYQNPFTGA